MKAWIILFVIFVLLNCAQGFAKGSIEHLTTGFDQSVYLLMLNVACAAVEFALCFRAVRLLLG